MKIQTGLTNKYKDWSSNKKYRVGDVISLNGALYQNTTGKNSRPELLYDWVLTESEPEAQEDVIIARAGFDIDTNSVIYRANSVWLINDIRHTNTTQQIITLPNTSNGLFRLDISIATNNNTIEVLRGQEGSIAYAPDVPIGSILMDSFLVSDSGYIVPTPPDIGIYKAKTEDIITNIETIGVLNNIALNSESSHLYLNNATELKSVNLFDEYFVYDGKKLILTNNSTVNITIRNNASGSDVFTPFVFTTGTDYILKPKESIVFYYSLQYGKFYFLSTNLSNGYIQSYKFINSNVTLDNTYNNAIWIITNTCTITIPTGLDITFNAVALTVGNYIATFAEASGVTLNAISGKKLNANKNASIITIATNSLVLRGELSV